MQPPAAVLWREKVSGSKPQHQTVQTRDFEVPVHSLRDGMHPGTDGGHSEDGRRGKKTSPACLGVLDQR